MPKLQSQMATASLVAMTSSGLLTFTKPDGSKVTWLNSNTDLIDVKRMLMEADLTAVSGTSPTLNLRVKTRLRKDGTTVAAATHQLRNAAGTEYASGNLTAAGRTSYSLAVYDSDTGAATLGTEVAVFAEIGGTTPSFTGEVRLLMGQ